MRVPLAFIGTLLIGRLLEESCHLVSQSPCSRIRKAVLCSDFSCAGYQLPSNLVTKLFEKQSFFAHTFGFVRFLTETLHFCNGCRRLYLITASARPADDHFEAATNALKEGLVVAVPTDTLYGLAADAG